MIVLVTILISCKNKQNSNNSTDTRLSKTISIKPLEQLSLVDKLLTDLAEKPQQLSTASNKPTKVKGKKGTIIHINPNELETIDGSPFGNTIQIELLELTNNSSLIWNNTQTVSNGEILITGGAYYINMTSNGKQLKIKEEKGLKVEFPKLTENEMGFFLGEKDSLGQINWIQTKEKFISKKFTRIKKPKKPVAEQSSEIDVLDFNPKAPDTTLTIKRPKKVEQNQVSSKAYKKYLKELEKYKKTMNQIEYQKKTYQAVKLLNFGWINCDRFYDNQNPKTNIELTVNNDSIIGTRIFAIFKDINSIMTTQYWKGQKSKPIFKNIPNNTEVTILAVSIVGKTPLFFEKRINTSEENQININFVKTTQNEIKEKINNLK